MAQLDDLTQRDAFIRRHIGPGPDEITEMLKELDLPSLDALIDRAVPSGIRTPRPLDLGDPEREDDVLAELRALASRNEIFTSMIGMGYYDTYTPAVILRNVLEDPAWYTSYTPYQPEISQGRLEALLNFQTMVADLTGMEIANASLLDEGTAAAEAMAMTHRLSEPGSDTFFVDADTHPQTIAVIETRAHPLGIEVVVGDPAELPTDIFGVLLSYPGSGGEVRDLRPLISAAHSAGALVAVTSDLLALVLLTSPGEMGADVVVGSSQRFGVPLGFGGPHAGFLAGRDEYKRHLPGRLVGVSKDDRGRVAYRLALQTREQHIRREKATSNICTAQVLLAVIASFYGVYHGPDGLRTIAERVHRLASVLSRGLAAAGVEVAEGPFFDTLMVRPPGGADALVDKARRERINLRRVDDTWVGISVDETTTAAIIDTLFEVFGVPARVATSDTDPLLPSSYRRTDAILTHPVFGRYHSETEMLRYLRRLADKDIALDRSMIPLGSCTMKLNATTEMIPITWPEFGGLHPFAPLEQAAGYRGLIGELEEWLAELTGYDAVSLQPNSGAQGEFAGLLAIRGYHHSRGDDQRDICLIPISAHGTNPASATMAGMEVVAVAADDQGNIDVDDLRRKAADHTDRLAALMITYPSTHGVFESEIREICRIVHHHGGQVYMDGANLNAMLGIAKPGEFGSDVSHLNLHKTFTIPHGGGGPGVGPIGVGAHLAPFLPNHPLVAEAGPETGVGPISAAPWGSAGILPISWAYIRLMGAEGLHRATEVAILNANYVAARLADHFPVLYTGTSGLVAHECIIDVRPFKESAGVTVDDIAKRLVDYGFHAPTMSFPVAGTLMIEPTESESKAELDRFCEAMISIRGEIARLEAGEWDPEDNPLHNSPHPAEDVVADDWDHAYGRELAAYPLPALRSDKWWSPVGRIDARYGDRNVVCSCPPMTDYT